MIIKALRKTEAKREAPVSRIGQRRQIVIPKSVFDTLRLSKGDFMEIKIEERRISMRRKKLVNGDEAMTPAEAKKMRHAIEQMKAGKTKPWLQLKHELGL